VIEKILNYKNISSGRIGRLFYNPENPFVFFKVSDIENVNIMRTQFSILKKINSRYFPKVYDWYEDEKYCCYSIERIDYPDILKWSKNLDKEGKYEKLKRVLINALEGIGVLHRMNIIHSDIKPSHILVGENLDVKILDPSVEGNLITPEYTAPETFFGENDFSSDIYSLGLIFYEIIKGEKAFSGSLSDIIKMKREKLKDLSLFDSSIPYELNEVIKKMVIPENYKRFRNVEEIFSFLGFSEAIKVYPVPVFVGRKKEIERFNELLNKNESFIIVIRGESGIGKTSILRRLEIISREYGKETYSVSHPDEIGLIENSIYFLDDASINSFSDFLNGKEEEIMVKNVSFVLTTPSNDDLKTGLNCINIKLEHLNKDEIKEIIDFNFPTMKNPDEIVCYIHYMTGGNPFFVSSILQTLCDKEFILKEEKNYIFNKPEELNIDLIDYYTESFEKDEMEVLRYISIFKRYAPFNLFQFIDEKYLFALKRLLSRGILKYKDGKVLYKNRILKEYFERKLDDKDFIDDIIFKNKDKFPDEIVFERMLQAGLYDDASILLKKIIRRFIKNKMILTKEFISEFLNKKEDYKLKILLGFIEERIGNNGSAEEIYSDVINYLKKKDYFLFRIGVNRRKTGKKDAEEIFKRLIESKPLFKQRIVYEYGRILLKEKRYKELREIIEGIEEKKIPEILFLELLYYTEIKEYEKMLSISNELLKIEIDDYMKGALLSLLGSYFLIIKDYENAIKKYNEAIEINMKNSDTLNEIINRFNLSNTYIKMNDYDRAEEEIEKGYRCILKLKNKIYEKNYLLLLSSIYLIKGRLKEVNEMIERFEKRYDSFDEDIIEKEFYAKLFIGDFLNAEKIIDRIKDEKRKLICKGYLSYFRCEFEDAIDYLKRIVEFPEMRIEAITFLIKSLFFCGMEKEGKELINKYNMDEIKTPYDKGCYYSAIGIFDKEYLNKGCEIFDKIGLPLLKADIEFTKGLLLLKDVNFEEGIRIILKAQETFKSLNAYGYLYKSIFLVSEHLKSLSKKIFYKDIIGLYEKLFSFVDGEDISGMIDLLKNFMGAERGALIIKGEKVFGKDIDDITISDAKELSKTAIKLAEKGEILLTYDAEEDERFSNRESVFKNKIKSILCVPVISDNEVLGILYLDSTIKKNLFTEEDKDLLFSVGRFLGKLLKKGETFVSLMERVRKMEKLLQTDFSFYGMIGVSDSMRKIFRLVEEIAPLDLNVLITGETGTGKGMLAEIIHNLSKRKDKKFIRVECTSIPRELFESELFGHIKGSFTGAIKDKVGLCEMADGGTLFLDEIGEIPIDVQSKLLRLIEDGEIRRVGDTEWRKIDTRIISATNKELDSAITFKEFRADLYYRLKQVHINIPPLRARVEDIPIIIDERIKVLNDKFKKNIKGISKTALKALIEYSFPGNVRELINLIDSLFIFKKKGYITLEDIEDSRIRIYFEEEINLKEIPEDKRKGIILNILRKNNWNVKKTASALKISERQLFRLIKKYGIKKGI